MNKQLVTKIIFWLAFVAFLSVSIPHVAWLFHAYEPQDLLVWWVIAYAVAIGIDILICWLSWGQSNGGRTDKAVTWLFIGLLAVLSWYANYLYSMIHNPAYQVDVWNINLGFGVTTGQVTPIIVSAIPIFIIAYTFMLNRVNKADMKPKSASDLKIEADELALVIQEKQRIATLKRAGKVGTLTGLYDAGKAVVNHWRAPGETQEEYTGINEQGATGNAGDMLQVPQEQNTDKLTPINAPGATGKDEHNAGMHGGMIEQNASENDSSSVSTGQKSVSIKAASLLLGLSESYTRTLVNNGKLRSTPRNKKMILKSSIEAYINARKDTGKIEVITPGKTPLMIVPGEQVNDGQNERITLSFIEMKMYDALVAKPEEMTELLTLLQEQSLADFTNTLKARYSEYSSYITPERVSNVMQYISHTVPAQNGHKHNSDIGATEVLAV